MKIFTCTPAVTVAAAVFAAALLMAATPARAELPPLVIPAGFGLNPHFRGDNPDLDLVTRNGFAYIRTDLFWDHVEKTRGVYDFAATGYDGLVAGCDRRGIRIVFILDYSNRLYEKRGAVQTDAGRAAFAAFARAAAERYAGRGIIWEIWNEPNFESFWNVGNPPYYGIRPIPATMRDAADYTALVKAAAPAIHAGDPSGLVAGPTPSEIRLERGWVEECFRQGLLEAIDVFSIHPYRKQPPESVLGDYAAIRLMMRDYAKDGRERPIMSSEWGYSLVNWDKSPLTPETQAAYLVRMMLVNQYARVPISIWYTLFDGAKATEREDNFGIVTAGREPKPAALAARTLSETLAGYRVTRRLDPGLFTDYDYVLELTKGDARAVAFWTMEDGHELTLPIPKGSGVMVDMYGVRTPVSWDRDGYRVTVSPAPRYLLIDAD